MTDSPTSYREAVARIIREASRGCCEVVAYHKVYAVTEAAALEIADTILALREEQPFETERRLQLERDEALDRIEELERDAEIVSEEFEKDCWRAMRSLLEMVGWTDFSEGVTAEDAREIISDAYREALSASPVIKGGGLGAVHAHPSDGKRLSAEAAPVDHVAEALDLLRDAKTRMNVVAAQRSKIGPIATQAQTAAHSVAGAIRHLEALPSPAKPLSAEGEG